MRALLIIDMQKISFTPETPRHDANIIVERINKLSDKFRNSNNKVIFIQHEGSKHGCCKKGTEEWEILETLIIEDADVIISKTANDSFYKTNLDKYLKENNINEILITGCATDFCVDSTVKSALNHDFNITLISDAHTTADRSGIKAEQLINHYNWIWSELIPTGGSIELKTTHEILNNY